jgi:hypothetical protein
MVANLVLSKGFQEQPTGLLEISAEARANGLHAALLPAAQGWQDIAGKLLVTGGSGTRSTSGSSLGNTRKLTAAADFFLDPTAGAPGSYMWVLRGRFSGLATWAGFFSRTADNGTGHGWAWQRESSNDRLRVYHANDSSYVDLGTVNDLLDNLPHTLVGVYHNGRLALYRDGVLIRSATLSGAPAYVPGQGQVKIGSSRDVAGLSAELSLAALFYPRGDPNAYAQALSINPWRIFRPARRVLYFDVGGGGGAAALNGAAYAAASASASLTTAIPLVGAAASIATTSGALSTAIKLSGDATATATATGDLITQIVLSGSALAQAIASAGLYTGIPLSGDAKAVAAAVGSITTQITLSGQAIAAAMASGALTAPGAGLSGSAQAQTSASGSLVTAIPLVGDARAYATADGGLTTLIKLSGVAASVSAATGNLTISTTISGAALAAALASSTLTTQITLSGDALSFAVASGMLDGGTAAIDYRWSIRPHARRYAAKPSRSWRVKPLRRRYIGSR